MRTVRHAGRIAPALLGLVALAVPACHPKDREEEDRARLAAMEAEIDAFIQDRSCASDGDCRVIAFGAKPCGGPWTYKVWSAATVDSTELARLVADYNAYNAELNRKWGWASTCDYVLPPTVGCVDGSCAETP